MSIEKRYLALFPYYLILFLSLIAVAFFGSRGVTVLSENAPFNYCHNIVLDAGHGGVDGGATSCTGVLESKLNLQITIRLNDLLRILGIRTIMIRDSDISVYTEGETIAAKKVSDLKRRVEIVNNTPNATVVSIHQNHFTDSRYSGAQTFYANTEGSAVLAQKIQRALVDTVNIGSNRKAKKADSVFLMQKINCTGVLIECGFLSNPVEEGRLRDAAYQKKLSCVIASQISQYICTKNAA